jgi:hypothetical protein
MGFALLPYLLSKQGRFLATGSGKGWRERELKKMFRGKGKRLDCEDEVKFANCIWGEDGMIIK